MPPAADRYAICVALVLAAAAAVVSAQDQPGEAYKKLRWLLSAGAAPEAAVMAGAIGENPGVSAPPRPH
jgi:hypothetical protein